MFWILFLLVSSSTSLTVHYSADKLTSRTVTIHGEGFSNGVDFVLLYADSASCTCSPTLTECCWKVADCSVQSIYNDDTLLCLPQPELHDLWSQTKNGLLYAQVNGSTITPIGFIPAPVIYCGSTCWGPIMGVLVGVACLFTIVGAVRESCKEGQRDED